MKYLGEKNHNVRNLISNNSIIKIMEKGANGREGERGRREGGRERKKRAIQQVYGITVQCMLTEHIFLKCFPG